MAGIAAERPGYDGWKAALETLDSRLKDLAALLRGVPLPMVMIGSDERIIAANPGGEAILGTGQIGRHHAIALRQPDLLAAIEAALHRGIDREARHVVLGPSHEVVHRVTVSPVAAGGESGALCAFEDITDRELIDQFRRDFVANVSHELRTPLTTLVGLIETLKGAAREDPAARDRFLATMTQEAGRMNRLVQDLLSLSKVEAEERQRPTTPVSIAERIETAVASLRATAEETGIALEVREADTAPQIPADADQLLQVLRNLIENALKYGAPGTAVTIALHAGAEDEMLRIDVIDRGDGIAPMHLPRLTERFYRVDDHRSREKGGTGLGLSIVKHILHRHRGRLEISSTRGTGSCFSVYLPRE